MHDFSLCFMDYYSNGGDFFQNGVDFLKKLAAVLQKVAAIFGNEVGRQSSGSTCSISVASKSGEFAPASIIIPDC